MDKLMSSKDFGSYKSLFSLSDRLSHSGTDHGICTVTISRSFFERRSPKESALAIDALCLTLIELDDVSAVRIRYSDGSVPLAPLRDLSEPIRTNNRQYNCIISEVSMNLPIPSLMARDIYKLTPQDFLSINVKFLMLDLDNTLSPYHINDADQSLRSWVTSFKDSGLELFILSNNHGERPAHFAAQLGIDYINRAKKPNISTALSVMEKKGYTPKETAIIGDQIFTDVLCGVRCGFFSVCVRPICISHNPLLAIRYFFELPFRLAYKGGNRT